MSDEEFLGDELEGVVPAHLVDDTYLCELVDAKRVTSKKDKKQYVVLNWEVRKDGPYYGEDVTEIYRVATAAEYEAADGDEQKSIKRAHRDRLARFIDLGVPESDVHQVSTSTLKGAKAYLTLRVRPNNQGGGMKIWVDSAELAGDVESANLTTNF